MSSQGKGEGKGKSSGHEMCAREMTRLMSVQQVMKITCRQPSKVSFRQQTRRHSRKLLVSFEAVRLTLIRCFSWCLTKSIPEKIEMTGSELVPSTRRLVNRRKRKNVFLGDGEIRTFLFDNGG